MKGNSLWILFFLAVLIGVFATIFRLGDRIIAIAAIGIGATLYALHTTPNETLGENI